MRLDDGNPFTPRALLRPSLSLSHPALDSIEQHFEVD